MTKAWGAARIDVDEASLRVTVQEILRRSLGRDLRVDALDRRPSEFATLFPADVLTVTLDDGERITLFLKHLGPEEANHPDKCVPSRELAVYSDLLVDPGLPVPRPHGTHPNPRSGRQELFLEYVDGWSLQYHDLQHWRTAARELARLHSHFGHRRDALAACRPLLRLDAGYFRDWTARARHALRSYDPERASRLEEMLPDCQAAAELVGRAPVTLVHNDLSPKNVLTDTTADPARIRIIDWEMAGTGCGLLDLVHLAYGLDPADAEAMLRIYRAELEGSDLLPAAAGELVRLRAGCELHKTVYRLAHCREWGLSGAQMDRLLIDAGTAREAL